MRMEHLQYANGMLAICEWKVFLLREECFPFKEGIVSFRKRNFKNSYCLTIGGLIIERLTQLILILIVDCYNERIIYLYGLYSKNFIFYISFGMVVNNL